MTTTLMFFCDRIDDVTGEHACELDFGHAGDCACECPGCLA